jgi:hypothetical protein
MSTKKILKKLLENDIGKKLEKDEYEAEYKEAINEVFNIIKSEVPEVMSMEVERDYDPIALTITFYITEYYDVIAHFNRDGELIGVNIDDHLRYPWDKDDVAQIKLAYILLTSSVLRNYFQKKIPKIIELYDKL